jgi:hypothetical protein
MPRISAKFTKRLIDSLPANPSEDLFVLDVELPPQASTICSARAPMTKHFYGRAPARGGLSNRVDRYNYARLIFGIF